MGREKFRYAVKLASGRAVHCAAWRGRRASLAGGREEEPVWISLRNRVVTPEWEARSSVRGSGLKIRPPGPGPGGPRGRLQGRRAALKLTEFPLEEGWHQGDWPSRVGTLNPGYRLSFLLLILQLGILKTAWHG